MSKDDPKESHERKREALAIDPKLGHGDVVTRGKLQQALERPEAVEALRAAAAKKGTDTTDVSKQAPRKPAFLNTEEYRLARELVGATKSDGAAPKEASASATDDDTTVVRSERGKHSGNTQRLIPDEAPDSGAGVHVEVAIVDASKVEVPGGERLVVAGEVARRLPPGDPTAATMEVRLSPEKLEELDEKAHVFIQANMAGLEVPPEAKAERMRMIEQLAHARVHQAAAKRAEQGAHDDDSSESNASDAAPLSEPEPLSALVHSASADPPHVPDVEVVQEPTPSATEPARTQSRSRTVVFVAALGITAVAVALFVVYGSGKPPSETSSEPATPTSSAPASAASTGAPATSSATASSAQASSAATAVTTSATSVPPASTSAPRVHPSVAPSAPPPPPPSTASSGRPDPGGFRE